MLNRQQAIIWTNADPFHWPIYAALGGEDLMQNICNFSVIVMELSFLCIMPSILANKQNGRKFAYILKCIFLTENICLLIQYSLKCVHGGVIEGKPSLLQAKNLLTKKRQAIT